jgi:hypothetical protein
MRSYNNSEFPRAFVKQKSGGNGTGWDADSLDLTRSGASGGEPIRGRVAKW